jgi:hypothetical protein
MTPIDSSRVKALSASMSDDPLGDIFAQLEEQWVKPKQSLQTMRLEQETAVRAEEVSDSLGARIESSADALRFLTAGKACVTLVSKKTGRRFTYRVNKADSGEVFFVSLLTGADNVNDYAFFGTIFVNVSGNVFRYSARKARVAADAPGVKAFEWAFRTLSAGKDHPDMEIWHEGSCGRCGRRLTVPESIRTGFGPECYGRMA